MVETERKRRRAAVSCAVCRRRKLKCNRENPCSNCVRSKTATCIYEDYYPPVSKQAKHETPAIVQHKDDADTTTLGDNVSKSRQPLPLSVPLNPLTPASSSTEELQSPRSRLRQLHGPCEATFRTTESSASYPDSHVDSSALMNAESLSTHVVQRGPGHPWGLNNSVTHKTRLFGQTHWINIARLFRVIVEIVKKQVFELGTTLNSDFGRAKALARIVKSRRTPAWPTRLGSELPAKAITDKLVACYLSTVESIYRIVHIPAFQKDYDALWVNGNDPGESFFVLLKLIFAIGAATYDGQFSLRASATHWVYEAQTWLSEPKSKPRLGIQFLQINILLLLAREAVGVAEDSTWVSAGELLRRAMHLGYHRDPARLPKMSNFAAEVRRRLWNTILEIALQSSLAWGGPPLFSINDFDTEPPANFDDNQLVLEGASPQPAKKFTQASIAIALRKTLSVRLAVAKFLNDFDSNGTYVEMLRIEGELRTSYKVLSHSLQPLDTDKDSDLPVSSQFAVRVVDFTMNSCLSALHVPFFSGGTTHETPFAYSRKIVLAAAIKTWYAVFPAVPSLPTQAGLQEQVPPATNLDNGDALARLTICGNGFYRTTTMKAGLLVALNLQTQLQEEEALGAVPVRPDMLAIVHDVKKWSMQCILAGETNVKSYMLMCIISAYIDGLNRGHSKEQLSTSLLDTAEAAVEECIPILEDMAGSSNEHDRNRGPVAVPDNVMQGWDFLLSDSTFNATELESMNWIFDDEIMAGMALS